MRSPLRNIPFDPIYIILQIASLQTIFYAAYTLSSVLIDFLLSIPFNKEQVFGFSLIHLKSRIGWSSTVSYLIAFIAAGFAFSFIVQKITKALDFISSALFIHLIVVIACSGFPTSIAWWFISIFSLIVGIVVSVVSSMPYEAKSINTDEAFLMH